MSGLSKPLKEHAMKLRGGWILALVIFTMAGCGGVGGGVEGNHPTNALIDVTGSWEITETVTKADDECGIALNQVSTWTFGAVQEVNNVSATATSGAFVGTVFSGIVQGYAIQWTGTYPLEGGTTTITSSNITVYSSNDGLTLHGTENWEWTDGTITCDGEMEVTGNKL